MCMDMCMDMRIDTNAGMCVDMCAPGPVISGKLKAKRMSLTMDGMDLLCRLTMSATNLK